MSHPPRCFLPPFLSLPPPFVCWCLIPRPPAFADSFRSSWRRSEVMNYGRLLKKKPVLRFIPPEPPGAHRRVKFSHPLSLGAWGLSWGPSWGQEAQARPPAASHPDLDFTQTFSSWEKRPLYPYNLFSCFQQVTFSARDTIPRPNVAQGLGKYRPLLSVPFKPPGDAGMGEGCLRSISSQMTVTLHSWTYLATVCSAVLEAMTFGLDLER